MRAWLSAAWHVQNPFASTAVTCTMSQLRTSSERKLSLSATRQPFTVEIALLFVFSLSNSLFFVSFLCLSDLSHTQEQAGSMPWMQAVAPSRAATETAVRRCERSTKEPIATSPSISKDLWASCGSGTLNCAILSKYELLRASARRQFASARRQIGTGLFFFVQTFVDFALSLPGHSLWVCLRPGPWIFSQKRRIRTRSEN